jgi:hypothetical protein
MRFGMTAAGKLNHGNAIGGAMLAPDDGGTPGGGTPPEETPKDQGTKEVDFAEYLKGQPKEVQEAHAKHEAGLKSALEKERAAAREASAAKAEIERQQREAAERTMAEQGKYKELADSYAAKFAEIEPKISDFETKLASERAAREAAEAAVSAQVDAQLKDLRLPAGVVALLDGKTPTEKLQWLAANAAEFKSNAQIPPSPNGVKGGDKLTEEQKHAKAARTW